MPMPLEWTPRFEGIPVPSRVIRMLRVRISNLAVGDGGTRLRVGANMGNLSHRGENGTKGLTGRLEQLTLWLGSSKRKCLGGGTSVVVS
jgi:hypothetical protein